MCLSNATEPTGISVDLSDWPRSGTIAEAKFWEYVMVRLDEIKEERKSAPEWRQNELSGEMGELMNISRYFFNHKKISPVALS